VYLLIGGQLAGPMTLAVLMTASFVGVITPISAGICVLEPFRDAFGRDAAEQAGRRPGDDDA
jgi:hypothetical protein